MPHCTKCGAEVPASAQFCQKCGQPQPATPAGGPAPSSSATSGLSENAAATLSYSLGWFTGIIFFLIDQRPYVRFHAAQSVVTFGGLHLIRIVIGLAFGVGWGFGMWGWGGGWGLFGIGALLLWALGIIGFVLWIVCMIKAYQGQWWKVPVAGDIASNLQHR